MFFTKLSKTPHCISYGNVAEYLSRSVMEIVQNHHCIIKGIVVKIRVKLAMEM